MTLHNGSPPLGDIDCNFSPQINFIQSGGLKLLFSVLIDTEFLTEGDNNLKRWACSLFML